VNTTQPTPPPDKPQGAEPHFITVYSGTGTFTLLSADKQVEIPIGDELTTNEIRDELNEYITKQLTSARNSIIACKAMLQVDAAELTAATEALEKAKAELVEARNDAESWKTAREESEAVIAAICKAAGPRPADFDIVRHVTALAYAVKNNIGAEQSGKREAALREALESETSLRCEFGGIINSFINACRLDDMWPTTERLDVIVKLRDKAFNRANKPKAALSQQAPTNDTTGSTPQG
jgi:hypothetical protein